MVWGGRVYGGVAEEVGYVEVCHGKVEYVEVWHEEVGYVEAWHGGSLCTQAIAPCHS